ncbi:hypothetical protein M5689_001695 [Euphorbia peplus]|nr:hypothetical protein M5689_001695 [Euphorbia peplus]
MPIKNDFQDFPFQDNRKKVDLQNNEFLADRREKDSSESGFSFDLRQSLAWDSAFFDSPGVLDPEELCETLNIQLDDNISGVNRQAHSESSESARVKRISNMRKSLAWDNAFFTNAGVLDAEELSIVNRGFKRPDMIRIPGAAEDETWRSHESNSTVNSDGYSLAGLEIDLFDDIRSSARNASSNVITKTSKVERKKGKSDGSSRIQHGASSGESGSSSRKPPKIRNPSQLVPSKRPSQVNKATNSATGKKMCLRESGNALASSMTSLKSPSSVLSAARHDHPGLRYASADLISRSPSNPRRRIDSQMATSLSSFRTPAKCSNKNKTEVANSSDSIRLFSRPKSSLFTSPCSSIDTSSSEQLWASVKQRSNSSALSDASKTPNCAADNHVQSSFGYEFRETKLLNSQTTNRPISVSRKQTPSRLRLPSPKLGFFDAEKSVGLSQDAGMKFHSGAYGSANVTRNSRSRTLTGSVSKLSKKDEGKMRDREKPDLKEHGYVKVDKVFEHNKENVSLEKHVHCLTQRMGAMNFSRDSGRRK